MHDISQININNRQTVKRLAIFAFLLCLIFIVSIFSETIVMTHVNHEHDRNGVHGSCTVCAQIQNAENRLKQLGVITGGTLSTFAAIFAAFINLKSVYYPIGFLTLMDLKIRMNN